MAYEVNFESLLHHERLALNGHSRLALSNIDECMQPRGLCALTC